MRLFFILLFFRKINPSQNRIAADLAESTNAYNMRKLQVNAQITAVISSIEFFFLMIPIFENHIINATIKH